MKKLLPFIFSCIIISPLSAQFNNAIQTSSWGGVSNVTWNPSIADGRYEADISLGSMNSGFIQNHAYLTPVSAFKNTSRFTDLFTLNLLNDNQWKDNSVKSFFDASQKRNLSQFNQFEGPGSFMIPFGKGKNAIAASWHLNTARTIHNFSSNLASLRGDGVGSSGFPVENINISQATWADYGITYSRVFYDKDEHFFKGGFTFKVLHAFANATVQSSDFAFSSLDDTTIRVQQGTVNASYNNDNTFSAGGDIGFVYEWRPKKEKYTYDIDTFMGLLPQFRDVYKIAAGFSVIDIGALRTGTGLVQSTVNLKGQNLAASGFNIFNTIDLASTVKSKDSARTAYKGSKSIWLPTRFNMYIDYNIWKGFKLNLNASISPYFNASKSQVNYGSYISLVPRFDVPMFGFYLPITYHFNQQVSVGASMRAGPVWFGVSDFIGMASKGLGNITIFGGVKIPIYYHKPNDKDGDKVSNRYDNCRTELGTWLSRGCPDSDGDGIKDGDDYCPGEKGTAELKGCPDADGDGITDRSDDCPNKPGELKYKGCPDTDGDGLSDKDDRCPLETGSIALKGCPDADGDGVSDADDSCKTAKGALDHFGCPDTDGDGVYDNDDEDMYSKGPVENHGKPWEDSDGDGIYDNEDSCKLTPGKKEFHGCAKPPKPNLVKMMSQTYDTLFFEIRETEVTQKMERILQIFAGKMKTEEQRGNTIYLIGHTDNTETEEFNRETLSIDRALAAKNYLIGLGIDKKRIEYAGEGDDKPLNANLNPTERKKNRRVEIVVVIVPE